MRKKVRRALAGSLLVLGGLGLGRLFGGALVLGLSSLGGCEDDPNERFFYAKQVTDTFNKHVTTALHHMVHDAETHNKEFSSLPFVRQSLASFDNSKKLLRFAQGEVEKRLKTTLKRPDTGYWDFIYELRPRRASEQNTDAQTEMDPANLATSTGSSTDPSASTLDAYWQDLAGLEGKIGFRWDEVDKAVEAALGVRRSGDDAYTTVLRIWAVDGRVEFDLESSKFPEVMRPMWTALAKLRPDSVRLNDSPINFAKKHMLRAMEMRQDEQGRYLSENDLEVRITLRYPAENGDTTCPLGEEACVTLESDEVPGDVLGEMEREVKNAEHKKIRADVLEQLRREAQERQASKSQDKTLDVPTQQGPIDPAREEQMQRKEEMLKELLAQSGNGGNGLGPGLGPGSGGGNNGSTGSSNQGGNSSVGGGSDGEKTQKSIADLLREKAERKDNDDKAGDKPVVNNTDIDDPKFNKYKKMQKIGMPDQSIKNKMKMDGLSQEDINLFFGESQVVLSLEEKQEESAKKEKNKAAGKIRQLIPKKYNITDNDRAVKFLSSLSGSSLEAKFQQEGEAATLALKLIKLFDAAQKQAPREQIEKYKEITAETEAYLAAQRQNKPTRPKPGQGGGNGGDKKKDYDTGTQGKYYCGVLLKNGLTCRVKWGALIERVTKPMATKKAQVLQDPVFNQATEIRNSLNGVDIDQLIAMKNQDDIHALAELSSKTKQGKNPLDVLGEINGMDWGKFKEKKAEAEGFETAVKKIQELDKLKDIPLSIRLKKMEKLFQETRTKLTETYGEADTNSFFESGGAQGPARLSEDLRAVILGAVLAGDEDTLNNAFKKL
ncbi:MAG: hypothetical protein AAF471_03170 [Myxococcota bacterium]